MTGSLQLNILWYICDMLTLISACNFELQNFHLCQYHLFSFDSDKFYNEWTNDNSNWIYVAHKHPIWKFPPEQRVVSSCNCLPLGDSWRICRWIYTWDWHSHFSCYIRMWWVYETQDVAMPKAFSSTRTASGCHPNPTDREDVVSTNGLRKIQISPFLSEGYWDNQRVGK